MTAREHTNQTETRTPPALDSNPSINELRRLIPTIGMDTTLGHQNTNNPFNNTLATHHQRHNQHSTLGDHNLSTGKNIYVFNLDKPCDYYLYYYIKENLLSLMSGCLRTPPKLEGLGQ